MLHSLFNSHPYKEDDGYALLLLALSARFSTHILTRRMTAWADGETENIRFSTYILTRRMTFCVIPSKNTISFQLTSSQGGWRTSTTRPIPYLFFNSHPHKEDDGNSISIISILRIFNSHPHKEDDDLALMTSGYGHIFQLTSSQGGWQNTAIYDTVYQLFQLTSSQGGWQYVYQIVSTTQFFNSHPHKEDDDMANFPYRLLRIFNSHPHKEDDDSTYPARVCFRFSTHILTRRMTQRYYASC